MSRSNILETSVTALKSGGPIATSPVMPAQPPPEVIRVHSLQVACDGSGEIAPALGHPRVYLRIDAELGFVECGYCDRRFVLEGGPADSQPA
jgi:NADH dehydrogenase (ubiquinone) Fe-S protein 6